MVKQKNCEFCGNEFKSRDKRQIARFCSSLCNRKVLRKKQLEKYKEYLLNETEEQKLAWLKNHFEKFVIKKENDCWDWKGSKVHGYANFNHRGKIMRAHRASWLIHYGEIPSSLFVLHKCDVRHCSNPEHLFLGNHIDNMHDMDAKKRRIIGDPRNKLDEQSVKKIKELLSMGVTMSRLSKDFHVHRSTIARIKNGRYWKAA